METKIETGGIVSDLDFDMTGVGSGPASGKAWRLLHGKEAVEHIASVAERKR